MEPISNLITLKQERKRLIDEMRQIHDKAESENRNLNAEERQEFDRMNVAVRDMTDRAQREEDMRNLAPGGVTREVRGRELGGSPAGASSEDEYRAAFLDYIKYGAADMSAEARQILRTGWQEQRDTTVAGAGAYQVPQDFHNAVVSAKVPAVAMRRTRAQVINTTNGRDLPIPVQTAYGAAAYLSEASTASNTDDTGSKVTAKAYTAVRMTKVSFQLLEDSAFDVQALLAQNFAKAFAQFEDPEMIKGTGAGSSHITGAVTNATTVFTCAVGSTTTFTYTDLLGCYTKIQPQYRVNGEWVLMDTALATLLGLKDSSNRPIWTASALPGEPDSLMGKPLYTSPNFATEAANSLFGLFGDFNNGYAIRQDGGLQIRRSDERFIDSLETVFVGYERLDGVILDATAFTVFKHSAT